MRFSMVISWEHLRNALKTTNRNYWELYENALRTMWNKVRNSQSKTFLKTMPIPFLQNFMDLHLMKKNPMLG
jgi:hypothetical protein